MSSTGSESHSDPSRNSAVLDIDGNGKIDPWEMSICRICLMAMLGLALGKEAISLVA